MKWFQRFKVFLDEVWTEIRPKDGKVTWPTMDEVKESTMVVFLCVAIFGVYLFALDITFRSLVGLLVGRQ